MKVQIVLFFEPSFVLPYLHLNFYLILLNNAENIEIKKSDRINVEEPFFEYVTPHKQGEAKFMLTKKEQEFINQ